ncbi:MAG: hypothetical protein NXH85_05075 [Pseudomonadaceae bacterium]|nr:hypothetical protein [Pseudomonadaceae bacterium]
MSKPTIKETLKSETSELVDRLRKERDEMKLQSHLLKAELKDEWQDIEGKWEKLERRLAEARHEAHESAEEIGAAIHLVVEEISNAYQRLRNRTNSN